MLGTTGLPETFPSSGFCLTCWHWGEASPEDQPDKGSLEGLHRARLQSHPHGWLRKEERLSPLGAASLPAHPGTPPPSPLGHRQVTAVQETSDTRRTQGQGACGSVSPGHRFPCTFLLLFPSEMMGLRAGPQNSALCINTALQL